MTKQVDAMFERFFQAYLETAIWSSSDETDDQGGEPLDKNYTVEAFTKVALKTARKDCQAFYDLHGDLMCQANADMSQHGHDFWLTRNRHGAGFWDRGYGAFGDELSTAAKAFGECHVLVNRKRLHIFNG